MLASFRFTASRFDRQELPKGSPSARPIDQFCRMKVCDLAHQLVSGLLRIRGIEDWLRFAFACRHEASARIAVNFGGWRAAHAQGQSAKRSQFRPSMRNEAKIIGSSAARTSKTYRRISKTRHETAAFGRKCGD
jgi:hypothetical protein